MAKTVRIKKGFSAGDDVFAVGEEVEFDYLAGIVGALTLKNYVAIGRVDIIEGELPADPIDTLTAAPVPAPTAKAIKAAELPPTAKRS